MIFLVHKYNFVLISDTFLQPVSDEFLILCQILHLFLRVSLPPGWFSLTFFLIQLFGNFCSLGVRLGTVSYFYNFPLGTEFYKKSVLRILSLPPVPSWSPHRPPPAIPPSPLQLRQFPGSPSPSLWAEGTRMCDFSPQISSSESESGSTILLQSYILEFSILQSY